MITLSPLRWGKPYESLDFINVVHFDTKQEPIAKIGTVGGRESVGKDMRFTHPARERCAYPQTNCWRVAIAQPHYLQTTRSRLVTPSSP